MVNTACVDAFRALHGGLQNRLYVRRMVDHRGMLDDLAALLRALPPSRAVRKETRRMEQQAGLGGAALVRVHAQAFVCRSYRPAKLRRISRLCKQSSPSFTDVPFMCRGQTANGWGRMARTRWTECWLR